MQNENLKKTKPTRPAVRGNFNITVDSPGAVEPGQAVALKLTTRVPINGTERTLARLSSNVPGVHGSEVLGSLGNPATMTQPAGEAPLAGLQAGISYLSADDQDVAIFADILGPRHGPPPRSWPPKDPSEWRQYELFFEKLSDLDADDYSVREAATCWYCQYLLEWGLAKPGTLGIIRDLRKSGTPEVRLRARDILDCYWRCRKKALLEAANAGGAIDPKDLIAIVSATDAGETGTDEMETLALKDAKKFALGSDPQQKAVVGPLIRLAAGHGGWSLRDGVCPTVCP